ncbi:MAG: phosphatase PAP2 family protein [Hyphomicrobiales bacterium]
MFADISASSRSQSWTQRFTSLFGASLLAHLPFIGLIALYALIGHIVIGQLDDAISTDFSANLLNFVIGTVPVLLLCVVTMRFVHLAIYERPERPAISLYYDLKGYLGDPGRLATALPMIITLLLFFRTFALIKANIPSLQPFSWDPAFIELDRILHFGRQPWEWMHPILGYPPVTFAINFLYNLWFIVMWVFWVYFAFDTNNWVLRARFFLSFILLWAIGGGTMAVGFSSAGPCYLGPLGLDDTEFASLMTYLHNADKTFLPLWALDVQEMLWQGYVGKTGAGAGISAMPSMHNASALLFALAGWKLNRVVGWLASIFAAIVLIGSVHLGWHYAVDGYVGFAVTLIIWWASKPLAIWMSSLSVTQTFLKMLRQPQRPTPSTP